MSRSWSSSNGMSDTSKGRLGPTDASECQISSATPELWLKTKYNVYPAALQVAGKEVSNLNIVGPQIFFTDPIAPLAR